MLGNEWNIFCIGAGALGLMLGYILSWSTRRQEPSAIDAAALIGTAFGGTILTVVDKLNCPQALPIYIIGLGIGFSLYLIALRYHWTKVLQLINEGKLKNPPVFPWLRKCHCNDKKCN